MQVVKLPTNKTTLPRTGTLRSTDYVAACDSVYPTSAHFSDDFTYRDYLHAVAALRMRGRSNALALYFNLPFFDAHTYSGDSGNVVSIGSENAALYLSYLKREIKLQGRLLSGMNRVEGLHFSGAPLCLNQTQLEELMLHVHRWFKFAPGKKGEYSIEVDPYQVAPERLYGLRELGFNRICLLVGSGNMAMHHGDDRIKRTTGFQPMIEVSRAADFRSIKVTLVCSPSQRHRTSDMDALAEVIKAKPDRIGITYPAQALDTRHPVRADDELMDMCARSGYIHVGLDQFALPADDWIIAQTQGRLHHNLYGYSTRADMNLISFGVSAISSVGGSYSQNVQRFDAYYDSLDRNELPVARGMRLSIDDILRRTIVEMLTCQFELSIPVIEQAFSISFAEYFQREYLMLAEFERCGLVAIELEWLTITATGRKRIRDISMVFCR
ncbi:coproporphyrinogen III oxidase [Massilia cavernae]|uniref:Coproporphyrinogen III oxidase n=1 Tax=Massilia cavernae TaxID=2320864 RepID=A0A418XA64_9BURK|nr:coproporphyrinogen III oxidase [Massilia cavernae]RJG09392.1 coproporphyrinogen III oxidase [Massilia cavernae]